MQSIKSLLKQSFAGKALQRARTRRRLRVWTAEDQRMRELYSQFLKPGDLCFDVGANIGNRVKVFLELGAQVVAVEPQQECVRTLREHFGAHAGFNLVECALGAAEGQAEMNISSASTVSSLSQEWVDRVRNSGRFSNVAWNKKQTVRLTTLDLLIEQFGRPDFIKIDVEGFEHEVLAGLSSPVPALSLEFTPEYLQSTFRCIAHLAQIGEASFNYALGESMSMAQSNWLSSTAIIEELQRFTDDISVFGDVYVRFPVTSSRQRASCP